MLNPYLSRLLKIKVLLRQRGSERTKLNDFLLELNHFSMF